MLLDLSLVICCYNGQQTIQKSLDSATIQSYPRTKYEIIIINDGSTDESNLIIKDFVKKSVADGFNVRAFHNENKGLSASRNIGFRIANSLFVSYFDQDAYLDYYFTRNVVGAFKANQNINVLGGMVRIWNENSEFARLYHNSFFAHYMSSSDSIIGTNMSFKKEYLEKTGGFDEFFRYRGDESAFFAKNRKTIQRAVDNSIIVFHTQPNSLNFYLKSRYENGYFGNIINRKYLDSFDIKAFFKIALFFGSFFLIPFSSFVVQTNILTLLVINLSMMCFSVYVLFYRPYRIYVTKLSEFKAIRAWDRYMIFKAIFLGWLMETKGMLKCIMER